MKTFDQNPSYVNTGALMVLLIAVPPFILNFHAAAKSPLNIIDLTVLYFLVKRRSEAARIVFLIRLGLGSLYGMLQHPIVASFILNPCIFFAPAILMTGKSKRWRLVTAWLIFLPAASLTAASIFVKTSGREVNLSTDSYDKISKDFNSALGKQADSEKIKQIGQRAVDLDKQPNKNETLDLTVMAAGITKFGDWDVAEKLCLKAHAADPTGLGPLGMLFLVQDEWYRRIQNDPQLSREISARLIETCRALNGADYRSRLGALHGFKEEGINDPKKHYVKIYRLASDLLAQSGDSINATKARAIADEIDGSQK